MVNGEAAVESKKYTGSNLKYRWCRYFHCAKPNVPIFRTLDMLSFKP